MTTSAQSLSTPRSVDPITQARIHLAAAYRLAALHELDEGIDNHFTMAVPGREAEYLILPFGFHWSEARASDMISFDEQGTTREGRGPVELSAQCIHAPIHRITGAKAVLHTHQTWATALNMLQNNRLLPTSQTAAFLHGQIAYDDDYAGTACSLAEGERLARLMGSKPIVFLKNHGVLAIGDTVAQAYCHWYAMRWKIETFHKILKSGCKAEESKLRTAERLVNLISVYCILSWRIFWMTMINRVCPDGPPTLALTKTEITTLERLRTGTPASSHKTVSYYLTRIARLGGYLARKGDPPPGNMVMWRGITRLADIVLGLNIAKKIVGN